MGLCRRRPLSCHPPRSAPFPSPAREPSCRMSTDYYNFWSSSYTFSFFTCLLQGPSPLPVADMINRRDTSPSLPRVILLIRDATSLAKVHPALAGKLKFSFTWAHCVENHIQVGYAWSHMTSVSIVSKCHWWKQPILGTVERGYF